MPHHIQFSTNISVPSLLSACRTSRETILNTYTTCLESGGRKIRMDGENDTLVLFSTSPADIFYSGYFDYKPLPWQVKQTMHPVLAAMFSSIKSLATPYYLIFNHGEQQWFLSQLQSLERFFPMQLCQTYDLNTSIDEIHLAITKEQLARLELECSPYWQDLQGGHHYHREGYLEAMENLQRLDRKLDVMLAVVGSSRNT